jgi:hypothetical protein
MLSLCPHATRAYGFPVQHLAKSTGWVRNGGCGAGHNHDSNGGCDVRRRVGRPGAARHPTAPHPATTFALHFCWTAPPEPSRKRDDVNLACTDPALPVDVSDFPGALLDDLRHVPARQPAEHEVLLGMRCGPRSLVPVVWSRTGDDGQVLFVDQLVRHIEAFDIAQLDQALARYEEVASTDEAVAACARPGRGQSIASTPSRSLGSRDPNRPLAAPQMVFRKVSARLTSQQRNRL